MTRARRIWHLEHRFGYSYATNQFGGFTRHDNPEDAIAAIERDITDHGDRWRDR
ncbi:hypothetical protein ACTD5D_40285 [Nocardia takedensis]|uniref:hypothetical protein n=1 Tax=Nocardia takedensis TaxID=259390 RepID=UPI003F75B305